MFIKRLHLKPGCSEGEKASRKPLSCLPGRYAMAVHLNASAFRAAMD
jgi:hypothetical protein